MPDVTNLATAFLQGSINPSYTTLYAMMGYSLTPQELPSWVNCDGATTNQVASLLGGTSFMAPPPGNYNWGANVSPPLVPWVRTSGGDFVVGDIFPPGVILDYSSLCVAATSMASAIPGGTVGNSCVGGGVTTPAFAYQNPVIGVSQNPVSVSNQVNTTNTNTNNTQSTGAVGAEGLNNAVGTSNTTNNTQSTLLGADWLDGSMIGGIPNWGLLAAAGLALFLLMGRK